ncbi:MAG TPA: glycosyltransferase family 2 protein [Alphaproteobacteria bacterium]|jgi:GT2 family glycosyltransferase|nr:glycosyltransferase family 2 protein [Alphaproteobacteria bacterium]
MDLSIVIVNYNTKKITEDCIKSIVKNSKNISYEIILVNNSSSDKFKKTNNLRLITNKLNVGFATANNQGVKIAKGKYILFLNSDTIMYDNVLGEMVNWMENNSQVGVATCGLKNKDGSLQATGGFFPTLPTVFSWMTIQDFPFVDYFIKPFHPFHTKSFFAKGGNFYSNSKELDWVTGAFLLTRREILEKVGGWDESYFMYVEEVDLCFKIKKLGYKVSYLPKWSITHLGGASSKTRELSLIGEYQGIKKFYKNHYPKWQFPILRSILKIGAVGRIILFGILEGSESAKIYAQAFRIS